VVSFVFGTPEVFTPIALFIMAFIVMRAAFKGSSLVLTPDKEEDKRK